MKHFLHRNKEKDFVGIVPSYRDGRNFEHDMLVGPCACGAWHKADTPPRDFDKIVTEEVSDE